MRIALVGLTYPFRGGIAHYSTLLYKELEKRHQIKFFAIRKQYPSWLFPGKTQLDCSKTDWQIPNEPCLDSMNPLSWLRTYRLIRDYNPDLILFSWWSPFFAPSFGTVAWLAKKRAGISSCFICHNVGPHEPSIIDNFLLKRVFTTGQAFITHSGSDLEQLEKLRPGAIYYQTVHPTYEWFAQESMSREAARQQLGLNNQKTLLFFGFIREYKGLHNLLKAMLEFNAEENYHLLIVGEFYDNRKKYQTDINRLIDNKRLTLVDRYVANEEISIYFSAADIVIVPYLTATQSGIVQIAYGFRKPVIATRVGGLPEAVIEGQTGYLIPPGDSDAIVDAVRKYFKDSSPEVFQKNIENEMDKYSWKHMVDTIEKIGEDLKPIS